MEIKFTHIIENPDFFKKENESMDEYKVRMINALYCPDCFFL
jgi:hypothetical protein